MNASLLKGVVIHASFYGAYAILFTFSVYIHWKKRTTGLWIHLAFLSSLFILATIMYMAILDDIFRFSESTRRIEASFKNDFHDYTLEVVKQHWDNLLEDFYESRTLLPLVGMVQRFGPTYRATPFESQEPTCIVRVCYILSNLVADVYITYRCYIVWGQSKKVILLPVLLIVATLVFQIGPGNTFDPFTNYDGYRAAFLGGLAVSLVTNFFVTSLTASRIWWMGRQASFLLQTQLQSKYNRTIQIVLESGLLYPITLFATLLMIQFSGDTKLNSLGFFSDNNVNSVVALNLCIVSIAPTLIIIRVGLGVSADDVQATILTFKAAEAIRSDETQTVIDIRRESVAQA